MLILFVLGLACIHIATIANHLNVLRFIINTSKNVNITVSLKVYLSITFNLKICIINIIRSLKIFNIKIIRTININNFHHIF